MLGNPCQRQADTDDGVFNAGLARDLQTEITGNGIDPGSIQWDATPVDGGNQLAGAGVGRCWRRRREPATPQSGKKALGGGFSHTLAFA